MSFLVTDGTSQADPEGATALLTIPISVGDPNLEDVAPSFTSQTVTIEAGEGLSRKAHRPQPGGGPRPRRGHPTDAGDRAVSRPGQVFVAATALAGFLYVVGPRPSGMALALGTAGMMGALFALDPPRRWSLRAGYVLLLSFLALWTYHQLEAWRISQGGAEAVRRLAAGEGREVARFLDQMQQAFDKNLHFANARQIRGML